MLAGTLHAGESTVKHILVALALAPLLLAPTPAQAGDEFEGGFNDEMGRIAAHEAVYIGRGLLARILLGPPPGYPPPAYAYPYPVPAYRYAYPPPPYWSHGPYPGYYYPGYHYRHHHHHHGHHHHDDCD
jgi:hypothetical protein